MDLPIACTLAPGEFRERLASINALARDALRSHERRDLVLDLRYAPEAWERVREMVRNEQACCSFLGFDLWQAPDEIRLTITAPEAAREATDMLFEQFVAAAPAQSTCACAAQPTEVPSEEGRQLGTRAASLTAVTLATGAVACGACCVLPFALPAAALAGTGSILAWLAGAHAWVAALALFAVIGAWLLVAWQTARTGRKPGASTLYVMAAASILVAVAVLWPLVERSLLRVLNA